MKKKKRIELLEKRFLPPFLNRPAPIPKQSKTSMIWNICIGQLGLAVWLCSLTAPAHLLVSRIWETGKSP